MSSSSTAVIGGELPPSAVPEIPWTHLSIASPGAWVSPPTFDRNISANGGDHLTYLLWERQLDASSYTSFHAISKRLETSLAVQHESQFQLSLDPQVHHLTLHWLRIVRGTEQIDHLKRDRMRLIQRESQLERLVIDGQWTLLVVLEDVRPGDVVEAAYSYKGRHPIRPDGSEALFVVPPYSVVGRYRFQTEFNAAENPTHWLASSDAPQRQEEVLGDGRLRWTWEGQQLTPRKPEPNQPSSYMDYVWIQVSNLLSWQPLAARVAEIWSRVGDTTGLDQIAAFNRPAEVTEDSVHRLIRYVQDEFRYLSIDLGSGGWVPAAPGLVARRRYGDCKDLAWLTATVLCSWGATARPMLVASGLGTQVARLLPASGLFNHAIIEVTVDGKTRWFDLTARHQGGNFSTQGVGWFGCGLAVDASAASLSQQPTDQPPSVYAAHESILLDTREREVSLVEIRLRLEGIQADNMRRARAQESPEGFALERLKEAQKRYGNAERLNPIEWRDDRDKNICELVETFECRDVTYPDESGARRFFDVPPTIILQAFILPEIKNRRGPWSLTYPIEVTHEIEVKARKMTAKGHIKKRWDEPAFTASLNSQDNREAWSKTATLKTKLSEVSASELPSYQKRLNEFLAASSWRLFLPANFGRPNRPPRFGQFHLAAEAPAPATASLPETQPFVPIPETKLRRRRTRPSDRPEFAWDESISVRVILTTIASSLVFFAIRGCE